VRKRPPSTAKSIKTDIEELLPISQVKSLPRPPRVPTFDSQPPPPPRARRFPWLSLGVFAMVLVASGITLWHYRGLGPDGVDPRGAPHLVAQLSGDSPAVARIERTFWGKPEQVRLALLEEADRALETNDERIAELLYARARELPGDRSLAAHGLARVRLAQGDLEGAEGWILSAIQEKPKNPGHHALYADVLMRQGRGSEAQLERALARSLAHFSQKTRVR
jgi:tetratricopeptide (TPR) repeat protein